MKKTLLFILVFSMQLASAQNIGIGTNTPDSSALLELNSSSKGFLPPRMTTAQRNAIVNPAVGLQIYNTTTDCVEIFGKGKWHAMFCIPVDTTLITDIEGNSYPTVKICNQTWMAKNLDVARYRNGDIIPQVTNPTQWANLTTGAWCWYNNDSSNGAVYGRLYNWYAVNDPRGLAPEGWHVPSDGEWNKFIKCVDPNSDTSGVFLQTSIGGGYLKEVGYNHWSYPNIGATDNFEYTAMPSGMREIDGTFSAMSYLGLWWSNTQLNQNESYKRGVGFNDSGFGRDVFNKKWGFSVRCVKDAPAPSTLINNGLVAYYPFNGNANDESGNGNNGTVNGATLTTDRFGNIGKAYSFLNLSDRISVPTINCNNILVYSVTGWIKKANNALNGTIFAQSNGCNGSDGLRLFTGTDNILYWQGEKNAYSFCSNVGKRDIIHNFNDNQWHFFTVIYNGIAGILNSNQFEIYIDGLLVSSAENESMGINITAPISNTTFSTTIGNVNNGIDRMNGEIDDIRIYNRALTQEEISYLAGH